MTQLSFLKSLRTLVNYQRNCGISTYADSDGLRSAMTVLDNIASQSAENQLQPVVAIPEARGKTKVEQGSTSAPSAEITELSAQIAGCRHCCLHENRQVTTPGEGGQRPSLLIVGDWLAVHAGKMPGDAEIFGHEQDLMLAKMMAAIGLQQDEVFVTNIIKCSIPASDHPTAEHIATCSSYLKQQIAVLSPRIICAMGTAAAQMLIGTSQPLSPLRGRFHPCQFPSAHEIPVMPTYHPTYLLRNPEMKQAAWTDLQAIQRELTK